MNTEDIENMLERRDPQFHVVDTIKVGSQMFEGKILRLEPKSDRPIGHFIIFEVHFQDGKPTPRVIGGFNDVMTIMVNGEPFVHEAQ